MRALRIPFFVLILLVALSLANTVAMTRHCDRWSQTLDAAQKAVADERWSEADRLLKDLQKSWASHSVWLRVVLSHNTVDEADQLMDRARLMVSLQEATHARDTMAELNGVLERISGGEQLSLSNIL